MSVMWGRGPGVLLSGIFITWLFSQMTESVIISLQPKDNINILIKQDGKTPPSPPCYICSPLNNCKLTTLNIRPGTSVTYNFNCPTPEKYYVMEINKTIDCNSGICPFGNVDLQPPGLSGLNRTFHWSVTTGKNIGLELNFSTPFLRQIKSSSKCPDLVTFQIGTTVGASHTNIGTFCRNGTVSRIKVQGSGVVALHIPWNATFTQSGFSIANRSSIKRLCIIESTFQSESNAFFASANYPFGFPADELMSWQFILPPNHRASIQFLNYSTPNCDRKEERVEYYIPNHYNNPDVMKLSYRQPSNIDGNFNMSLQNCDLDEVNPGALTLHFKVIVQSTSTEGSVIYNIDLRKHDGLFVNIKRKPAFSRQFVPLCLICKTATDCEPELNLTGGKYYRISFLCKKVDDFIITAEKELACWNLRNCSIKNSPLEVPSTLLSLPMRLDKITWYLKASDYISAEISSSSLNLQQHVTEQPCNANTSSFHYDIISSDSKNHFNVGTFCPNGSIKTIQLRDNVTIILKPQTIRNAGLLNPDLYVSFVPSIREECIFTVTPKADTKVYLQTPNWEKGVPDYVTVSWSISVPDKQYANLTFAKDKMGIVCEMGRAYINIKEKMERGVDIATREDVPLPGPKQLYNPFWVNISNCKPKSTYNKLQIQFTLTFMQSNSGLIVTVIAACAAVVAISFIIGVTICCVKKKKKEKPTPMGIYNTRVPTETPSRKNIFRKARKNNESHVYAVIDDTMVYGHLLNDTNGISSPDVDVYRPFEGHIGDAPPVPPITFSNGSKKDENWEDPLALSMRENEIYTINERIAKEPVENEDTSLIIDERNGIVTVPST
ncbi:CUB domain-containing protein 1 [Discoglossus pictus]